MAATEPALEPQAAQDFLHVVELSGRHHQVPTPLGRETRLRTLRQHMSNIFGGVDPDRILFVSTGARLEGDGTLGEANITPSPATRIHVLIAFRLPASLLDGNPHPFELNGLKIGGDRRAESAQSNDMESFVRATNQLLHSVAATTSSEVLNFSLSSSSNPDSSIVALRTYQQMLEGKYGDNLPFCLRDFLNVENLTTRLSSLESCPMLPFVGVGELNLELPDGRQAACFLIDHQCCCLWYAVWLPAPAVENCQVYVSYGGQEFHNASFLTSRSFWKFLTDYALDSLVIA